jgi:CRP/FNR family cyclic AMP-dependent transcriptional regulator
MTTTDEPPPGRHASGRSLAGRPSPMTSAQPHHVEDRRFRSVLTDPARERRWQRPVRVFDHERALLAGLEPPAAELARHHGVADSIVLEEGTWIPPAEGALGRNPIGLLILDGLLARTLSFDGLHSPELLGAGDLLRPWGSDGAAASLAFDTDWRVHDRATVALLDDRFARRMCRFPAIVAALLDRGVQRSHLLACQLAIAHVRRADARLLMLFWHLADRWGRVTPQGVALPLRLTHATIAQLVCMRRPTVSATLVALARRGELQRGDDGSWLLTGSPPDVSRIAGRSAGPRLRAA